MRLPVNRYADILVARKVGAQFAARLGFPSAEIAVIATIVSEVTRGIIDRGEAGDITFIILENSDRHGLEIVARHEAALPAASSTEEYADLSKLTNEFHMISEQKNAITMTLKKWRMS